MTKVTKTVKTTTKATKTVKATKAVKAGKSAKSDGGKEVHNKEATKDKAVKAVKKAAAPKAVKTGTKRENKKEIISQFSIHPKDTGSSKVQVAILTQKINQLSEHLETHPKDDHSRRGLLGLVGKRRKHLNYLRLHDKETYESLLEGLQLRK